MWCCRSTSRAIALKVSSVSLRSCDFPAADGKGVCFLLSCISFAQAGYCPRQFLQTLGSATVSFAGSRAQMPFTNWCAFGSERRTFPLPTKIRRSDRERQQLAIRK